MFPWTFGLARPLTEDGLNKVVALLGVEPEMVWALTAVESGACGFLFDRRPKMRFEYSVFREYGEYNSLFGQGSGYGALADAYRNDPAAALKSASWGICQIMGYHYELIGFRRTGVTGMVRTFADWEDAQLLGAANFCVKTGCDRLLKKHDWSGFAHVFNGPGYRENQYDTKLADAFERFRRHLPDVKVRAEQMELMYRGLYRGKIDGIMGPLTEEARAKGAASAQA